eukprot:1144962-Pelagomonas_calceolata.AAC.6
MGIGMLTASIKKPSSFPPFFHAGVPLHVVSAPHLTLKDFPLASMGRSSFPHLNPRVGADCPPLPSHFEAARLLRISNMLDQCCRNDAATELQEDRSGIEKKNHVGLEQSLHEFGKRRYVNLRHHTQAIGEGTGMNFMQAQQPFP